MSFIPPFSSVPQSPDFSDFCAPVSWLLLFLVGAASGEIDLLPVPSPTANWTARLSVHYSQDSSLIYWFNGSQAAQVPVMNGLNAHEGLSDHFTLSVWMKHAVVPSKGRREEETVICSTVQSGETLFLGRWHRLVRRHCPWRWKSPCPKVGPST